MNEKVVYFNAYVDNLIQLVRDEDCWCDIFGYVTVTVPEPWLESMVNNFTNYDSLDDFYCNYNFDIVDGWLDCAIDEKVLVGVSMGKTTIDNDEKLNDLTTRADYLYTALDSLEDGETIDQLKLKGFLDELIDFLESKGGRVSGIKYNKNTL